MKTSISALHASHGSARSIVRPKFSSYMSSGIFKSVAATTCVVVMIVTSQAQPQDLQSRLGPFELQSRTANPLREPFNINFRPTPVALDVDHDGDTDVMVADFDGGNGFHLYRNDGNASSPAFNRAMYWANPFQYISFDDGATPTFSDV